MSVYSSKLRAHSPSVSLSLSLRGGASVPIPSFSGAGGLGLSLRLVHQVFGFLEGVADRGVLVDSFELILPRLLLDRGDLLLVFLLEVGDLLSLLGDRLVLRLNLRVLLGDLLVVALHGLILVGEIGRELRDRRVLLLCDLDLFY